MTLQQQDVFTLDVDWLIHQLTQVVQTSWREVNQKAQREILR